MNEIAITHKEAKKAIKEQEGKKRIANERILSG
jgi:hypothetical protein